MYVYIYICVCVYMCIYIYIYIYIYLLNSGTKEAYIFWILNKFVKQVIQKWL